MNNVVLKGKDVVFFVDEIDDGDESTMGYMEGEILRIVEDLGDISVGDLNPVIVCEPEEMAARFKVRSPAEEGDATGKGKIGFFDPEGISIAEAKSLVGQE